MKSSKLDRLIKVVVGTVLVFTILTVIAFLTPRRSGGSHTSASNGIINNLRQIEGAKEEWAIEHKQTGAALMTWEDVAPYLGRIPAGPVLVKPLAAERYILGNLAEGASAELTREFGGLRKRTILRLDTNGNTQIFPPKNLNERSN